MNEEIRKRLEEAARKEIPDILRINGNYVKSFITGFCFGGEWMFKECGGMTVLHDMRKLILAQSKEWLEENADKYCDMISGELYFEEDDLLADFETAMNKLWEEK